jgi:mannosyl-3-phosphoglycerate phosphatase
MSPSYIIFSDLDATLLDHQTYDFSAAQPALNFIKENHIPLVLVSSKTKAEMAQYQNKMGLSDFPFVVENGSAIYTAIDYFKNINFKDKKLSDIHDCYRLGISYKELIRILSSISQSYNYTIRGFHNISKEEIHAITGLEGNELEMSMRRGYSIPLLYDKKAEQILRKEIDKFNLHLLYGGRFMHLLSKTDKGKAMRLLMEGYQSKFPMARLKSIVIGDSLNDYAMLKEADFPILVKRHDNSYEDRIRIENLIHSPGIGPVGWNDSVLSILKKGGNNE